MTSNLIALAGVARAGKDTLVKPLVAEGWTLFNYGTVIKDFFEAYLEGRHGTSIGDIVGDIKAANPNVGEDQMVTFVNEVLLPYEEQTAHIGGIDAFTEDDRLKKIIRPVLEKGGDMIYDHVMTTYFAEVDRLLAAGKKVVNTRLVRIPEAVAWKERGGVIYEVMRADWPAASQWEHDALETLRGSGMLDGILANIGTAAEWDAFALEFAADLHDGGHGRAVA